FLALSTQRITMGRCKSSIRRITARFLNSVRRLLLLFIFPSSQLADSLTTIISPNFDGLAHFTLAKPQHMPTIATNRGLNMEIALLVNAADGANPISPTHKIAARTVK